MKIIEMTQFEFRSSNAQSVADCSSVQWDIREVIVACDAALNLHRTDLTSPLISLLWTAALCRYARAFATSKRLYSIDQKHLLNHDGAPELHSLLIDIRNKFIAHSVNGFEDYAVVVHAPTDFTHGSECGIGTTHIAMSSPGEHQLHQLRELACFAKARLDEDYCRLLKIVKEEVFNTPIEALKKLTAHRFNAPNYLAAKEPRGKS